MSLEVKPIGRVRRSLEATDQIAPGDESQILLNEQGAALVAHATSQYGEIVRAGHAFKAGTTTAVGAVVAIPTTAVGFAIYNNEQEALSSF